jgi:mycoredoxin
VTTPSTPDQPVTVYWRPGCGFCSALLRGLDDLDVDYVAVNIWEDPDAAAFVRQANRGDELVPTVDVAGVVLRNPSARQVLDARAA